jgi:class 3 adenylate cyclase/tetratricopeptide (TPR) repeat protein
MAACSACGAESREGARFCDSCGAPLGEAVREQRKTVTLVFCDVVGSTALGESRDPEAVRALLARYFERMRGIVEAHGGTVQKFIGDAVVAVFGVPVVHEDDALRALRAAVEMRDALPELGVEARIGVNTGEVVTSLDDTLVTGDAANVAARLQQAAAPGEVIVGAETVGLAGAAASVEELAPLELKGKAEPVAAFRLVAVGEGPGRAHGSRFVGRDAELGVLRAAWDRAVAQSRCELVTVVGEPGVGKSRLVSELLRGLGARTAYGGCLSYGEGITYRPVTEIVRQLGEVPDDPAAAAAIRSLLGESDAATTADEIAWAFRKLVEQAAPVVVVFDDIQWGEETFLDLVEHLGLFSSGAPILAVCLARPELAERRPSWPVALRLEPLPADAVDELLPASVPPGLRERIAHASGGNPLFVTEMIAMAAEGGDEVVVPATLKALLEARLDRLETAERGVLERGAVEGEIFHRGAVQALAPPETQVMPRLAALVRKELIRPERPQLPAEDGFRFCHLLIRDTAYNALPKALRAELHERFAAWLDEHASDLAERDEIVGYHLEQAYRYRVELDTPADAIAERAASHLAAGARRAVLRGDHQAVCSLGERALALGLPDALEGTRLQVELGNSLTERGRLTDAAAALDQATASAEALGERGLAALAQLYRYSQIGDPDLDLADLQATCERVIKTFAELGDERGLALAERLLGLTLGRLEQRRAGVAALDRALAHAESSGDPAVRRRVIGTLLTLLKDDSTPASEVIARCEGFLATSQGERMLTAVVQRTLALYYAMAGRIEEALDTLRESSLVLDEANELIASVLYRKTAAEALALAGDFAGAERELAARLAYFEVRGTRTAVWAIDSAVALAMVCCDDGRWEEAERHAASVRTTPLDRPNSLDVSRRRRILEARLAAHRGDLDQALALTTDALERYAGLDRLNDEAAGWLVLAEVQMAAGRRDESAAAAAQAAALFEQKGNVVAAARARALSPG